MIIAGYFHIRSNIVPIKELFGTDSVLLRDIFEKANQRLEISATWLLDGTLNIEVSKLACSSIPEHESPLPSKDFSATQSSGLQGIHRRCATRREIRPFPRAKAHSYFYVVATRRVFIATSFVGQSAYGKNSP